MIDETFKVDKREWNGQEYEHIVGAGEKIGIEIMPVNLAYDSNLKEAMNRRHSHDFYTIIWLYESGGEHEIDFNTYPIEKDTVFFIAPSEFHCCRIKDGQKGVSIVFTKDFIQTNDGHITFLLYELFHRSKRQPFCRIPPKHRTTLERKIEEMNAEYTENKGQYAYQEFLGSLLEQFMCLILRYGSRPYSIDTDYRNPAYARFQAFLKLVKENAGKKHTVKFYTDRLHICEKTLRGCTQRYAGTTPKTIIDEQIMCEAKRLLLYSLLSINRVAFALGFNDPTNFVKFFRTHENMTPQQFRKKYKDEDD